MEIIAILLANAFVLIPIIGLFALIANQRKQSSNVPLDKCERYVAKELDRLSPKVYRIFHNIVIPSQGNTEYTEIDHVIVSPRGIFCVETKSHHGLIFGSSNRPKWTQVLRKQKYSVPNPLWQNYKHTKAIETLLQGILKSKVESFVVFPNVYKLKVDNKDVFDGTEELLDAIVSTKENIYDLKECKRIIDLLSEADKIKADLRPIHISGVKTYMDTKAV